MLLGSLAQLGRAVDS